MGMNKRDRALYKEAKESKKREIKRRSKREFEAQLRNENYYDIKQVENYEDELAKFWKRQ